MSGKKIPITKAKEIANQYGYDQVIILGRKVGDNGIEWVTTYGVTKQHCDAAADIGQVLRDMVLPTIKATKEALEEIKKNGDDKSAAIAKLALEKIRYRKDK